MWIFKRSVRVKGSQKPRDGVMFVPRTHRFGPFLNGGSAGGMVGSALPGESFAKSPNSLRSH